MYEDFSGKLSAFVLYDFSGILLSSVITFLAYYSVVIVSLWDQDVRDDMIRIGCNPFNSDESLVLKSAKVSFYKGQFVIKSNFAFTSHRSFSFGIMFLESSVKDTPYGRDVVRHEWGHFVQLSIIGFSKFALFYGVPSMLSVSNSYYFSLPWERSANLFGGVSGSNWTNPHTPNSDIYSILYLIGILAF